MIEVDYVKISLLKIHALKSYRPKHPPERYFCFNTLFQPSNIFPMFTSKIDSRWIDYKNDISRDSYCSEIECCVIIIVSNAFSLKQRLQETVAESEGGRRKHVGDSGVHCVVVPCRGYVDII